MKMGLLLSTENNLLLINFLRKLAIVSAKVQFEAAEDCTWRNSELLQKVNINVGFAQQSIVISQVRCSAPLCLYSRAPSRLNSRAPGVACVWRTRLDLSCTQQEGRPGYDGMHWREKMRT